MNKNDFLNEIRLQFEEIDALKIEMHTNFNDLDTWDSLTRFSIIDLVKDKFNVEVKDFNKIYNPNDLLMFISNNSNISFKD
jgi:acyl carrier protein